MALSGHSQRLSSWDRTEEELRDGGLRYPGSFWTVQGGLGLVGGGCAVLLYVGISLFPSPVAWTSFWVYRSYKATVPFSVMRQVTSSGVKSFLLQRSHSLSLGLTLPCSTAFGAFDISQVAFKPQDAAEFRRLEGSMEMPLPAWG